MIYIYYLLHSTYLLYVPVMVHDREELGVTCFEKHGKIHHSEWEHQEEGLQLFV